MAALYNMTSTADVVMTLRHYPFSYSPKPGKTEEVSVKDLGGLHGIPINTERLMLPRDVDIY